MLETTKTDEHSVFVRSLSVTELLYGSSLGKVRRLFQHFHIQSIDSFQQTVLGELHLVRVGFV
jgi:hypothetical protein